MVLKEREIQVTYHVVTYFTGCSKKPNVLVLKIIINDWKIDIASKKDGPRNTQVL